MNEITLKSYSKINIGLKVVSKRKDGYHNIETIFQEIDLFDLIKISKISEGNVIITSNDEKLPLDERNICHKAVKLLEKKTGKNIRVHIDLLKRIPVGAGLGGGSSNAATVLKGIPKLYNFAIEPKHLYQMARELGADVPFFLEGGAALATGVGDKLKPIKIPFNYYCVLVYPNLEISTNWVYKNFNFNLTKSKKIIKLINIFDNSFGFFNLRKFFHNDLECIVFEKYPELAKIKNEFYERGAFFASMSGSGSSIFGLFQEYRQAEAVERVFSYLYQTFLTQPRNLKHL